MHKILGQSVELLKQHKETEIEFASSVDVPVIVGVGTWLLSKQLQNLHKRKFDSRESEYNASLPLCNSCHRIHKVQYTVPSYG